MALPYSTRFIAFSASSSPPAYVVPANYVIVVRDIDVTSGGGSIINWQVEIAGGAKFAGGQFTVVSIAQFQQWRGRVVLNAGEALAFSSDGALDGVVGGYLLFAGP